MSRGFLLDTCVFAEYSKPFPDSTVIDWLETNDASAYL